MFRGSRIGLTAVLVAALIALGASPASAATKKAGLITSGNSAILLNSGGFVKVTLNCSDNSAELEVTPLGTPLDVWTEVKSNTQHSRANTTGGSFLSGAIDKPGHIEWSVALNSKLIFGQVFVGRGVNLTDCRYTSQIS